MLGGNIGSALVDQYFLKRFLQERLSDKDYDDLVNGDRRAGRHGSGPHSMVTSKQHELLERFQTTKHGFSGDLDVKHSLQLPGSLGRDDNPRRGPVRGQVQITGYGTHLATFAVTLTWLNISKDLANMFEGSVSGIKALLLQQLAQVQLKGLRAQVRHVILRFEMMLLTSAYSRYFSPVAFRKVRIWENS